MDRVIEQVASARVQVRTGGAVRSVYADGAAFVFRPPLNDEEFCLTANEAGYYDPEQYGVERQLTHHWIAASTGVSASAVIWAAAHGCLDAPGRQMMHESEQHAVTAILRYATTGDPDPLEILDTIWGDKLPVVATRLLLFLRPWLKLPLLH